MPVRNCPHCGTAVFGSDAFCGECRQPVEPVGSRAIAALGGIGPAAQDAFPVLLDILRSGDDKGTTQSEVIETLARIDPAGERLVPILIEMIRADAGYDSVRAASALDYYAGRFLKSMPALRSSIPALRTALKSTDAVLRHNAREALEKLDPEPAVKK